MNDNPNHMYIQRHDLRLLRDTLAEIPALAVELGIAVTKQARLGEVGRGRKPRRPSEQPLPFRLDASEAAEQLHNCLVGWVRLVCEHRRMVDTYVGPTSTPGLARWLRRNLIALAMTPGSETALGEIRGIVQRIEWIVCPPARPVPLDEARVERARREWLNANGIATLARELGEEYRHLTRRRVFALKDAGLVKPVPGPWRPDWMLFVVGEVLDAHLVLPIRERHARRAERMSA